MARILILASISKAFRNFSFELLEALRAARSEVVISIPDDPVNADFEAIGCRVIPSPLNRHGMNPLAELRLLGEYFHLLREIRPDVVMTYTIKPNLYGGIAARWCGIPFLSTVTGLGTVFFNESLPNKVIRAGLKYSLRGAGALIFQNKANMQRLIADGFVAGPHRLVPGSGVNLTKHSLLPFPADDGKIRFLMPARAQIEKGALEYIAAAETIRREYPECEFHFAGLDEEPETAAKLQDAHEKGIIIKHGFLQFDAMRERMKSIQAVVLPSYHEGMSNVMLEGAAAGRVLLASDIPGCRETIRDGETGYLFTSRSAEALTDALRRFLNEKRETRQAMGLAGRAYVEQHFNREHVVAAYLEELTRLISLSTRCE
ncbi:MAG: glycosyltransferase family 4 protein [Lentisphaeria bacterium]|nr:glycosyltransferase family 4 protein [Lentisphaeria bacterium]